MNESKCDTAFAVRLPAAILERLAALVPRLARRGDLSALRLTRSSVLRLALLRGLAQLEREGKAAA
jgi:hypothetical protein